MAIELSRRGFLAGLAAALGAIGVPAGAVKLVAAPMASQAVVRSDFRKRLIEEIRFPIDSHHGRFVILGAGVPSAQQLLERHGSGWGGDGWNRDSGQPYASIAFGCGQPGERKRWVAGGTPIEVAEDAILQMGFMSFGDPRYGGVFDPVNHTIQIEMVVRDLAKFGRERKFLERHIIRPGEDHSLVEVRL